MHTWTFLMLASWVRLSQVTYEHCTAESCHPAFKQVQQRIQVVPSRTACEALKQQMEQTTGQSRASLQPAVEVSAGSSTLRQYLTFRCQEEA